MFTRTIDVEAGVWIDAEMLLQAGLNQQQLQIIVESGAILLTTAPDMAELEKDQEHTKEIPHLEQKPIIGPSDRQKNLSRGIDMIFEEEYGKGGGFR